MSDEVRLPEGYWSLPIRWHVHDCSPNLNVAHGHRLESEEQQHDHPHENMGRVVAFTDTEKQL